MTATEQTDPERSAVDSDHGRCTIDPWAAASAVVAVVLTLLALWPLFDLGRTALDLDWRPSGDWAAIVLRTEDVGSLWPLVGPYSRFGWNHPGPLLFWLLSIPYHLFGGRPESILAATALLNAVTVAAIAAVAWRRGRLPLVALTMLTTAILFHALGPVLLRDPWNPYVTLLPLALFVLLAWSVADGDHWMWPPLVFVASVELQSHIGYLPMLAVVITAAAVMAWRRRASTPLLPPDPRARRVLLAVGATVLVICWLPVLVDQFTGTGNVGTVIGWFASPDGAAAGFGTALEEMAGQLQVLDAPWLGAKELAGPDGQLLGASASALLLPFAAMGLAIWATVRLRADSALRFLLLSTALAAAGFLATARVIGPVYNWIVRWWWVIAALWWLSVAWAAWTVLLRFVRSEDLRRGLTTALAAVAALGILGAVTPIVDRSAGAVAPNAATSEVLGNFLEPVVDAVLDAGPVLVETTGSVRGDYGDAIRYALERAGVDVAVPPELVTHFGPERSTDERMPRSVLWVVSADAIETYRSDASMIELGGWDPLSPSERAAWRIEQRELQRQLRAAGRPDLALALGTGTGGVDSEGIGLDGVDEELLGRVEAVRRRGDPVAVFLSTATPQAR